MLQIASRNNLYHIAIVTFGRSNLSLFDMLWQSNNRWRKCLIASNIVSSIRSISPVYFWCELGFCACFDLNCQFRQLYYISAQTWSQENFPGQSMCRGLWERVCPAYLWAHATLKSMVSWSQWLTKDCRIWESTSTDFVVWSLLGSNIGSISWDVY